MSCLAMFFLWAAVKAKVRGLSITQACMKGYLHYLMVRAGHLMSHCSALAAVRGKRSSLEKCICHERMSVFDAYYCKNLTLDVNTSIHMQSRMYYFPFTEHSTNKTEHYVHVLNIFHNVCCLWSYTKVICDIINELCLRCAKKCISCVKYYPFLQQGN